MNFIELVKTDQNIFYIKFFGSKIKMINNCKKNQILIDQIVDLCQSTNTTCQLYSNLFKIIRIIMEYKAYERPGC